MIKNTATTPKILCTYANDIIIETNINLPKAVTNKKLKTLDWLNRITSNRLITIPTLFLLINLSNFII